ncbi:hypothetical protein H5410_033702 [Solanum commersonii]|uniref:Uncharacterized protein n=1 Tax=Solanum commersonii TaxID=4109 RepID=A0A9J5YTC2_SOLCO|nr:hypothetical protein H5410_033702 [Solanum commersonii]
MSRRQIAQLKGRLNWDQLKAHHAIIHYTYIIPLSLYPSLSFALRTPGAATREHKAQDLSSEPYLTALFPPYRWLQCRLQLERD